MHYISTRGKAPRLNFEDVVLAGLASDGGLYVPETIPAFTDAEMVVLRDLPYTELAYHIISHFAGDFDNAALKRIIEKSYAVPAAFSHADVAPLKKLSEDHYLLELFHGPTLAFKDFALQFLGHLLEDILRRKGEKVTVLGATSGDTGSAAIAGLRGHKNVEIFILHPEGRTSDVQRRQMTTVLDANVHNIALQGNFDDCQDIVKALFSDAAFREKNHLVAVNSINWARIVAQVVYYFYAALKLGAPEKTVDFTVPTGNFGDIFAGYIAKCLGLPVGKLVIASNANDILTRCFNTGVYGMQGVTPTLSPSMDIQISSNFERLLFDYYGRDGAAIEKLMQDLKSSKQFTLDVAVQKKLQAEFLAYKVDDAETKATIKRIYETSGELLDPHTAVGVRAAELAKGANPMITLSTAHPAKFPAAVKAATGIEPPLPNNLANLFSLEERFTVLPNDVQAIKKAIEA